MPPGFPIDTSSIRCHLMTLDRQHPRPAPFDTQTHAAIATDDEQAPVAPPASVAARDTERETVKVAPVVTPSPAMLLCKDAVDKRAVLTAVDCPHRLLLDQIADKWSVLILAALRAGPHRFNELKRRLDGVTQKALTQSLRRLERNGIVSRRVLATSPVAVEYAVTPLGQTLKAPFEALYDWTILYLSAVDEARARFDSAAASSADASQDVSHASQRPAKRD